MIQLQFLCAIVGMCFGWMYSEGQITGKQIRGALIYFQIMGFLTIFTTINSGDTITSNIQLLLAGFGASIPGFFIGEIAFFVKNRR